MGTMSAHSPVDMTALHQELEAANEKIADLEEKLAHAEQVQQAGTVLLIASLVNRLGGEVVLSNAEMGAIKGELQSFETFGGRVFRLVKSEDAGDDDGAGNDDTDED